MNKNNQRSADLWGQKRSAFAFIQGLADTRHPGLHRASVFCPPTHPLVSGKVDRSPLVQPSLLIFSLPKLWDQPGISREVQHTYIFTCFELLVLAWCFLYLKWSWLQKAPNAICYCHSVDKSSEVHGVIVSTLGSESSDPSSNLLTLGHPWLLCLFLLDTRASSTVNV